MSHQQQGRTRGEIAVACLGKVPFPTLQEATRVAKEQNRRLRMRVSPLNAYKCPFCGGYHIGRKRNPPLRRQEGME